MMKKWRKNLKVFSILTVFLMTAAGVFVSFHHHEAQAQEHQPCQVCSIHQQNRFSQQSSTWQAPIPYFTWNQSVSLYSSAQLISSFFSLGKLSQAPPLA